MTRIVITALVALLVSGPAWAGSQEIGDCESLIKKKLKFPGSFKREYVISDTEGLRWDEKKIHWKIYNYIVISYYRIIIFYHISVEKNVIGTADRGLEGPLPRQPERDAGPPFRRAARQHLLRLDYALL